MKLFLYSFLAFLCFSSCSETKYHIHTDIKLDSVQVELYHYASGRKVYSQFFQTLSNQALEIDSLDEDMYTLCLIWERSYLPHRMFKRKSGKIIFDEDGKYYLIKNIYINPTQSTQMKLQIPAGLSKDDFEIADHYLDVLRCQIESADYTLSEKYSKLYQEGDSLMITEKKRLKNQLFATIEVGDFKAADSINIMLTGSYLPIKMDNYLYAKLSKLAGQHRNSPVTTFYLFKELLEKKNFHAYQDVFSQLEGAAEDSPYYKMIKNQYIKRH